MILPPYGLFSLGYRNLSSVSVPMDDWRPDLPEEERIASFLEWRIEVRKTLADAIWPYFDRSSHQWIGNATATADKLTEIELDLLISHMQGSNSVLSKKPRLCPNPEFGDDHLGQYIVEDDPNQPAAINLRDYVCNLSESQFQDALEVVRDAYSGKKLTGIFWLKNEFVRTRPYQAAFLTNKYSFENRTSYSALHSSFYSGHCFEGIIISAAIAYEWFKQPTIYDTKMLTALSQFGVDFGDRRVFAGVHYPTDNIGSWLMALDLIPEIFADPDPVLHFIKEGILKQSYVYSFINTHYRDFSEFKPSLDLLDRALSDTSNVA